MAKYCPMKLYFLRGQQLFLRGINKIVRGHPKPSADCNTSGFFVIIENIHYPIFLLSILFRFTIFASKILLHMFAIKIESELKEKLPSLTLGCLQAEITIQESSEELSNWISERINELAVALTPETIRQMDTVKATKDAYRALGKDPNRYRPAAESLMRRIANGKGLYQISNVVDILNYISVKTGYSICGYDTQCIEGTVSMGIGKTDEPYEGIGRGELNIEQLPVFRDEKGAFGTPTSDSVRTMITPKTKQILFIFIGFGGKDNMDLALQEIKELLETHAKAEDVKIYYHQA